MTTAPAAPDASLTPSALQELLGRIIEPMRVLTRPIDRIAYAACIFPLTQRSDLNKSLGTRHRAALGLSEETDALVVVVSEENGLISHAYKGQLVRGVTIEELRSFMTSIILKPARSNNLFHWLRAQLGGREHTVGPAVITRRAPRAANKSAGK